MRKSGFLFFLVALVLPGMFAFGDEFPEAGEVSLEQLLDSSRTAALRAGERPLEVQFKNVNFRLSPQNQDLKDLVESVRSVLNPSVMVETLYLYQKPGEADKTAWTQAELAAFYNEVIALSSLKGIQYYSASRKTMRTLYETSSVIDNPSAKNPQPDPVYPAPLPELTLYARQKDLTFGDNIYQYTYRSFPGAIILVQENVTEMNYIIFTAVRKSNLRSVLAVLDAGEYILFYVVSMVKATSLPGMNDRIGSSFSTRAEAILQWAAARADRAFRNIS